MRLLQDHFGGHCGRPSECRALAIAAALLGLLVAAPVAQAQEPIQTFFVPVPAVETQIWAEALQPVVDNDVVRSVISITGTSAGTVIYYDHWEEGFEFDVTSPAQASTLIWGDSNPANGDVSLFCASCAGDTVGAGDIIILENDVDVTGGVRDPAVILFDGADKIQATQLLAVTRASWTADPPVQAQLGAAVEVFATNDWGTFFQAPVGEDLTGGGIGSTFEFVAASIMAEEDGTLVDVDTDGNGVPNLSQVLDQGESLLAEDMLVGGTISSSAQVQVELLTANEDTNYEGRWFSLIPSASWDNSYYSPVGTTDPPDASSANLVHAFVHNPGGAALDVNVDQLSTGCTVVNVPGGSTVEVLIAINSPPSAAHFFTDVDCGGAPDSGRPFFVVATTDRDDTIHDWGFTLIPESSLTPSLVVGWAPGSTNLSENVSPIWVTAAGAATTLYVDLDGDPLTGPLIDSFGNRYNFTVAAPALEAVRVWDLGPPPDTNPGDGICTVGDCDHTGMRIYTVDGTRIAAAWGQDPEYGSTSQPQQLDMGTTVVPFSSLASFKDGALLDDVNGNGQLDPGETILYTIRVVNNGLIPISDVFLEDTLDPNTTYEPGSTEVDAVPIPDDTLSMVGDTLFPLDADTSRPNGYEVVGPFPDELMPGAERVITFAVRVVDPFPPSDVEILNTVVVRSDSETFIDTEVVPVPRLDVTKTSSGPICPGDTVDYTITATNLSGFDITKVRVFDALPANTSYVAQSTLAVGSTFSQVADKFNAVSYSNNDGASNWAGPWIELDDAVPGPAGGQVQITGGQLSLDDQAGAGAFPSAEREVDLSGIGGAFFSFDWETTAGVDASDAITVEVSANGGGSYTTLEVITGLVGENSGSRSYDISSFIAANTRVRFRVSAFYGGGNEFFLVDNVVVASTSNYRDEFGAAAYNNSNGDQDWTADSWIETNDDGGGLPTAGSITIDTGTDELHLEGSGGAPLRQIERQLDLSGVGSATFTFDWRCDGDMEAGQDFFFVEVSDDGGGSWTTLQVKEAEVQMCLEPGDADSGSESFDISAFIAANTRIRFGFQISATSEDFYVDNVNVAVPIPGGLTKDNVPGGVNPDLVDGSPSDLALAPDEFVLPPSGILTLTYQVVADNPLTPADSPIVNRAIVASRESPSAEAIVSDPLIFAAIGNLVWEDLDENGAQNNGEPGIPNVTVNLLPAGCVGAPIATTTTNASGIYSFGDLSPIGYCVEVDESTLPANLTEHTTMNNPEDVAAASLAGCVTFADADFGYNDPMTVPVTLSSFQATRSRGGTLFEWTTATETANVGFNLYALTSRGWQRVNDEIVPSKVVDSVEPQQYSFESYGLDSGWFFIEDIDVKGDSDLRGPFGLESRHGGRAEPPSRIDWAKIRSQRRGGRTAGGGASLAGVALPRAALARPARGGVQSVDLQVDRDGIYRVTYEQLRDAGMDLAGVSPDNIVLTNQGKRQPLYVAGVPGPGSYFEFVGTALDTLYTGTNVYRLQLAGRRLPMSVDTVPPNPFARPPAYYLERAVVERNLEYSPGATTGDPWYDSSLLAFTSPLTRSFDLEIDNLVPGAAAGELEVESWGLTAWPQAPDHHLEVRFNGALIADDTFDGLVTHTVEATLSAGLLQEGVNELELTLPGDTGPPWEIINLERYSVTYPRRFVARNDRLEFTGRAGAFRVEGLSSPEIVAYRLIDGSPRRLHAVRVEGRAGGYSATFRGSGRNDTYLVSTAASLLQPAIEPSRRRVRRILRGGAEYLVISHPDFVDGLDPLIAFRRGQGYQVKVVDVDDVYALYSHGIFDPEAIRAYIADAAARLRTRYVLLVGGDSYDYRDYLGLGAISFMPSLYAQTDSLIRYAPVDPLYADVDGDLIADLALGRLPVRTPEELDAVIGKILAYEHRAYGGTGVFAADGWDGGGVSFSDASDALISELPPGWQVDRAYVDALGVDGARQVLLGEINAGVGLTSFFGHSGPSVWSFDGLFDTVDAVDLQNYDLPTVVTQWGCWNTYYVSPHFDSLGHKLLLSGDQGAAAVLGAATLTLTSSDLALGELFMPLLAQPGVTVGEALRDAKQALAATDPDRLDVLLGWTLLGDPALAVGPQEGN